MKRFVALGTIAIVAIAVARCSWPGADTTRALPPDRRAAIVYVALGDSTVEGVAATRTDRTYVGQLFTRLRGIYPQAQLKNLGVGGAVSNDVLTSQLGRAIALQPDLVTVSIGPNDVTGGVPVGTYEKNIGEIFDKLRRTTPAVIVVNLLPDLTVTPRYRDSPRRATLAAKTTEFNDALTRQARKHGVLVVDLYTKSRAEVPGNPALIAADGYHPSDLGYARWAELMWEVIEPTVAPR